MDSLKIVGIEVKHFVETDSTNNEAKRKALAGYSCPMLFIADSQTAGRGRMGRSFYSPNSTGLYMSYLYKPQGSLADSVTVTAAAAVAVVRAIEELSDLKPLIKWVNDIYIGGKKVCGILTESVTDKRGVASVVIGIGVNITTDKFPDELEETAVSLNSNIDRDQLAVTIVNNLCELIKDLPKRTFLQEYKEKSWVLGKEILFIKDGESQNGIAVDINRDGGLVVQTEDGILTLSTGEITLRVI